MAHKSLRRQLTKGPRTSREQWWSGFYREMKRTAAVSSGCNHYWLIRSAGPLKPSACKVIKGFDGLLIHSEASAGDWVEHFGGRR